MAVFQDNVITDAGRLLLGEVQNGAVFTPVAIVLGSGYLPAGTTTRQVTALVQPIATLSVNKKKLQEDGSFVIGGLYTNQDISEAFYFRELGVIAKGVYPGGEETAEILYSYGNAGETADYMPAYSEGQPVERQIDVVTYIGNDTDVDLTIESGVYVTFPEMEAYAAPIKHTHTADEVFESNEQTVEENQRRQDEEIENLKNGTGFNATATRTGTTVAITGPEEASVATFTAPADWVAGDTYTYNGAPLILTNLNNEEVSNGWKQGAPLVFYLLGSRAYFVAGGGGGFIEMSESIPAASRYANVLYGLILADFDSEEAQP